MQHTKLSLRDFIAARKAEIAEEVDALQQELRELQAVEATLAETQVERPSEQPWGSTEPRLTIQEMALSVLKDRPAGGGASQITEWIEEKFGADVARASLSPQLSRLKKEGKIVLEPRSKVWKHAEHVRIEGAGPEEGSKENRGSWSQGW